MKAPEDDTRPEDQGFSLPVKNLLMWGFTSAFVLVALAALFFLEHSVHTAGFGRTEVTFFRPMHLFARFGEEIVIALLWPVSAAADWLPGIDLPGVAYLYIGGLGFIYGALLFGIRLLIRREIARDA